MNRVLHFIYFFSLIILIGACKEPYEPPAIAEAKSYLVVEGFINIGGETKISLSRSTKLKDTTKIVPERRASVFIENEQNNRMMLSESSPGKYTLSTSGLTAGRKYRLRIKTTSSSEYLSDFVEALQTPEIDSISYKVRNKGVQFYANTNDAQNKIKYYRWEYDETWLYESLHHSIIEYEKTILQLRPPDKPIFRCWKTNSSSNIILGSSTNLISGQIVDNPVSFAAAESGKVSFGYSILIRQIALTKEAYEYWQTLKKNTEQLGSIFDPQPSIASGNIKGVTNPGEPVIGYLNASSVVSKRRYFDNKNFPMGSPSYVGPPSIDACELKQIMIFPSATFPNRVIELFASGEKIPVAPISVFGGTIGYTYSIKECVDCRLKGGTVIKPTFWP